MKEEALRRLLRDQLLLATASEEELRSVAQSVRVSHVKAGDHVAFAGDPGSGLHMLLEGELRSFVASPDGREIPIRTYSSGQSVGAKAIIQQIPLPFNVAAIVHSTVATLSRTHVRALLRSSTFVHALSELMAAELLQLARSFGGTTSTSAKVRVAASIASRLSGERTDGWPVVELPGQATMAALAHVSRETVSRVLKLLETEEVIIRMGRRLRIRDVARLRRIAAGYEDD
ncbi:cyclic nucleotide-binding domain-containing protein [Paraburkholderia sp. CNPSo 3157]|uniref:Cyclic nucleotide-binding domain-containing protein n=1 Tax=Paraburkholderia franconis TaxID=2654983 RepID=A0A7X1TFZ4_9BURK|nr:Crp/Fnr family transcriptional regulator [Paraburkholderia franconis]MPW17892.1 cyclic nucleotide-binding domain-containing protein [Paraburkholderia franconis]